ncbi:DsbA family oxidoreductase [Sedimentitalea arenosa]|uniref:DsbA family oxidoreductase n=1 Tax=Sedimentitalea arenosa TaxID=2798803 RepID=A0A8J7ITI4_9RHOB|nr:DsbA family oxidoreductase [Arenibacterium arenosum]MBJ6371157.1 DsbA family oxidoreductase [Arenibacterium arenosum]
MPSDTQHPGTVQVDIVSDVVCPWCIIGYRQLEQALAQCGLGAILRWHPFELNPDMGPEGENLRDHLVRKYGIDAAQSVAARERITAIGQDLGIEFAYGAEMRIVNTFAAHQLLDWALDHDRQHPLKLALFRAYFTEDLDVSDPEVLLQAVASVGLPVDEARALLASGDRAAQVRRKQAFWTENGISGVPAMVLGGKLLLSGAQGVETYAAALRQLHPTAA